MKYFLILATIAVYIFVAQSDGYSYTAQDQWPGICVTGNSGRQSPIDIITREAERNVNFGSLSINVDYYYMNGTLKNTGHNVEFTPESGVNAILTTPVGDYKLKQFHFHWGAREGEGTEHLVDDGAEELEIHFVHEKVGGTNSKARDALAVLAVRGRAIHAYSGYTDIEFKMLDVSQITKVEASVDVKNLVVRNLLPYIFDYYYYEGSLTTPDCDEIVQWFVLKHTINVPAAYLKDLRKIEKDKDGNRLTFNFRDTQDLADRTIYKYEVTFAEQPNMLPK